MSVVDSLSVANPWVSLTAGPPPHCCPADRPLIDAHNRRLSPDDVRRVPLDTYPEPYIGDPEAPILLLLTNPGYGSDARTAHATAAIGQLCVDNLQHRPSPYPFYPLNPVYLNNGGSHWWSQSLQYWIRRYGAQVVARSVFCMELFPYASRQYPALRQIVPSQEYSIAIAREKLRRGCTTIVVRKHTEWSGLLPELRPGAYHQVLNPQTKSLSPAHPGARGNLTPEAAEAVDRAMRQVQVERV